MFELVALKCHNCSTPLLGGEYSLLFSCPGCGQYFFLQERKLLAISPKLALPGGHQLPEKYQLLPFWHYTATCKQSNCRLFVAAFRQNNILAFGNPGRELTNEQPQLELMPLPRHLAPQACSLVQRPSSECQKEGAILVWTILAKQQMLEITEVAHLQNEELLFIPFLPTGTGNWQLLGGSSHFNPLGILH